MPAPNENDRIDLDNCIGDLSALSDTLTLDDFRSVQIIKSRKTAFRVKSYIIGLSILFMLLSLSVIWYQVDLSRLNLDNVIIKTSSVEGVDSDVGQAALTELSRSGVAKKHIELSVHLVSTAVWALALGGLGAVASVFLHVLRLLPEETLRTADEFEVVGRVILGCLFALILSVTLAVQQIMNFFQSLNDPSKPIEGSAMLLLPFLAGYSIPLVLGLLQKTIRAIELTLSLDDRRVAGAESARRRRGRDSGRKSPTTESEATRP